LHEEGVSCRLREPIPATASCAYLSMVTDQKRCAVSGRIMWINSLGNECVVKGENATTDWKQAMREPRALQIVARLTAGRFSDGC